MAGDFDFTDPPRRRYYGPPTPYPPTNSLGITSLVLGVVCLPLMCLPVASFFAVVIAGAGLLLGVLGLAVSLGRGGFGIGYAIGGAVVNAVVLAVAVIMSVAMTNAAAELDKQPPPVPVRN